MSKYLFRATIRGGGFYLLSRVNALAQSTQYKDCLITEGASTAVFDIDTDKPEQVREDILKFLYESHDHSEPIKEMMFLVEYLKNQGIFPELMARLLGKIRVVQMQTASVRLFSETFEPSYKAIKHKKQFDQFNQVLPAHQSLTKGEDKKYVSDFTYNRHEQGRDLRKNIYRTLLEGVPDLKIGDYKFTNELEELSKDDNQGNLNGKIAYIYIDGNKFGKLQKEFKSAKEFKYFDRQLQGFKKKLLAKILRLCRSSNGKKVRLETLLWGGDELKLIVPAWMGWRVASLFYQVAEINKMNLKATLEGKERECELTYAMGLVFTYHKNPVRNVDEIAAKLVDAAKDGLKSDDIKYPEYTRTCGNRMHYVVLESLETLPTSDYSDFAQSYYRQPASLLSLTPQDMKVLDNFVSMLDVHFSKSRVHLIAKAFHNGDAEAYAKELQRRLDVCDADKKEKLALIEKIKLITGSVFSLDNKVEAAMPSLGLRWLQAAELWDYLLPDKDN